MGVATDPGTGVAAGSDPDHATDSGERPATGPGTGLTTAPVAGPTVDPDAGVAPTPGERPASTPGDGVAVGSGIGALPRVRAVRFTVRRSFRFTPPAFAVRRAAVCDRGHAGSDSQDFPKKREGLGEPYESPEAAVGREAPDGPSNE
ncbi:hypothetical protein [Streptomyces sp. NPDC001068]|uniref:hypothetical protein n=1 Tax=Streptomyces sp. NPDC001068 TaxID=3364544 RepID=UPI0036B67C27